MKTEPRGSFPENNMTYRITADRHLPDLGPDERANVGHAYVLDHDEVFLAMGFDPGDTASPALAAHAIEMVTGLLYLRGWCSQTPEIRLTLANRPDRPWFDTRGPRAFIVEVPIEPPQPPRTDELVTIVELITLAWCMEHRLLRTRQRVPDLMTAAAPNGITLASVHVDLWGQALSDAFASSAEQAGSPCDAALSPSSQYVDMHLDGTGIRLWSLPSRQAVFVSSACEPDHARAFLALEDTHIDPRPERTRELLHLMLASGRDD